MFTLSSALTEGAVGLNNVSLSSSAITGSGVFLSFLKKTSVVSFVQVNNTGGCSFANRGFITDLAMTLGVTEFDVGSVRMW